MQQAELRHVEVHGRCGQQWNEEGAPDRAWRPQSFMDRGVAVPFTTPLLTGARARQGERGLEAVVPHPAGVRGVYIVAWSALEQYCAPTLHDLRMAQLISGGAPLVPPSIRRIARQVAAEGFAGRKARAAAETAISRDARARLLMRASVLKLLVEQLDGHATDSAELEVRARSCLRRVAMVQGRAAEAVLGDVEALSNLFVDHGVAEEPTDDAGQFPQSACTALLLRLERMESVLRTCAGDWHLKDGQNTAQARSGRGDALSAETTVAIGRLAAASLRFWRMGQAAVLESQLLLQDIPGLFAAWCASPERTALSVSRPEWLLDGWHQIVLQWEHAPGGSTRADTLHELAGQVPALPVEARGWAGDTGEEDDPVENHSGSFPRAKPGAALFDRVARNESMRALAA